MYLHTCSFLTPQPALPAGPTTWSQEHLPIVNGPDPCPRSAFAPQKPIVSRRSSASPPLSVYETLRSPRVVAITRARFPWVCRRNSNRRLDFPNFGSGFRDRTDEWWPGLASGKEKQRRTARVGQPAPKTPLNILTLCLTLSLAGPSPRRQT